MPEVPSYSLWTSALCSTSIPCLGLLILGTHVPHLFPYSLPLTARMFWNILEQLGDSGGSFNNCLQGLRATALIE
jgi:hypothetical protein